MTQHQQLLKAGQDDLKDTQKELLHVKMELQKAEELEVELKAAKFEDFLDYQGAHASSGTALPRACVGRMDLRSDWYGQLTSPEMQPWKESATPS